MNDKTEASDKAQSTTTDHIVIECPQCRTRFSLNALVLDGLSSPQFQCSDCEEVFTVNTHNLQRVSVISNSNPPEYPRNFPQNKQTENSSLVVNDWQPLEQSHDATFDEFIDTTVSSSEQANEAPSSFSIDHGDLIQKESDLTETFLGEGDMQTPSQILANSGWTLGDSSQSSENPIEPISPPVSPPESPFSFDDCETNAEQVNESQDHDAESSAPENTFSLDLSTSGDDQDSKRITGDFSSFFIESEKEDEDGPIQQELPFQLEAEDSPTTKTSATGSEHYREKDTLPFDPQVFVAPGEMGRSYSGTRKRSFWKDPFWLIAPVVALVLIFWGYSKFLHDKHSLIDSFISSTPEVAPAGLLIDDIRLEKLTLHGEEDVVLLSGRLKNKTIKTFEEIILESRILVNDVAQEVQRATAFSPLPHTDIKELSSDLLKELQSKRAARIQKLEPGQELHFKMILTPGVIEDNPVHSTRIYSVKAY